VLCSAPPATAAVTVESMSYKNFAREAADMYLKDVIHAHEYQIEAAKTRWTYQIDLRLLQSNAASWFDTQLANVQLMREEIFGSFFEARAADDLVREEMWRLRAAAIEAGQPEPVTVVAQHYLQMRRDNLAFTQKFADWANKNAAVTKDLLARARWAFSQEAMAQEELNYYIELDGLGEGFVRAAAAEIAKAQRLLHEAESDLTALAPGPG
jgi:hypothetical protein